MGELDERRWAVISERGCEATRLPYAEAADLLRKLRREKVSGLCVVTEAAAARLTPPAAHASTERQAPSPKQPPNTRAGRRKK